METGTFGFGRYSVVDIGNLKNIRLKYLTTAEELIKYLLSMPALRQIPNFLGIDDFGSFVRDEGIDKRITRLGHMLSVVRSHIPYFHLNKINVILTDTVNMNAPPDSWDEKQTRVYSYYFRESLYYISFDRQTISLEMKRLILQKRAAEENSRRSPYEFKAYEYSDKLTEEILRSIKESLKEMAKKDDEEG
eukprot:TRINITY_DN12698_c0_g1_i3.p1 TRINITY_DN12698_c0_g1~~TRINITY_DN12698_c0_g1_i3.p1  ORF type:complete len:191 (-),score=42.27 TRINITY_DN12698_c0_g1_i3:96-668(-)